MAIEASLTLGCREGREVANGVMKTACCIELSNEERDQEALSPGKLAAALGHLRESGYVVVANVMPSDRLDRLRARLDDEWSSFVGGRRPWLGGGQVIGHLGIHPLTFPEFTDRRILANRALLAISSGVLDGSIYVEGVGGNTNATRSVPQEFHSDVDDWSAKRLVINIPLCDVDERNGSLEAIPGTHRPEFQHRGIEELLKSRPPVRVNTRIGSVVIRFPYVIHRGTSNRSNNPRHMLAMWHTTSPTRTGNTAKPTLDPKSNSFLEDYGAMATEGKTVRLHSTFYPNIFPVGVRGMIKECTYRYCPGIYKTLRRMIGRAKHSQSLGG